MRRSLSLIALCAGTGVLVAGCGGSSSKSSDGNVGVPSSTTPASASMAIRSEGSLQTLKSEPQALVAQGTANLVGANGIAAALRSLNSSLHQHPAPGQLKEPSGVQSVAQLAQDPLQATATSSSLQASTGAGAAVQSLVKDLSSVRAGTVKQSAGVQTIAGFQGGVLSAAPGVSNVATPEGVATAQLIKTVNQAGTSATRQSDTLESFGISQGSVLQGSADKKSGSEADALASLQGAAGVKSSIAGGTHTTAGKQSVIQTVEPGSALSGSDSFQSVTGTGTQSVPESEAMKQLENMKHH
jgi:hypothetical protein